MADDRELWYEAHGIQVRHGDALEELASLPDKSVDLVLTDPPYFLPAEHYAMRTRWARSLSDLSIIEHFLGAVVDQAARILKPTGAFVCFCDGQSYPVIYSRAYLAFDRIADCVWDKGTIGMGSGIRRGHELILVGIPATSSTGAWPGWLPSVIRWAPIPTDKRAHPAQKPVEVLRPFIRAIVPEGGVVVDPFAGSGSVGWAARLEQRQAILIERDANYVREIPARLGLAGFADGLFASGPLGR